MAEFYLCEHCKNMVMFVDRKCGCVPVCCGEEMHKQEPNTKEAAFEKHIPVVSQQGQEVLVKIGDVAHPMLEAHYIEWVYLRSENGEQIHHFKPGEAPECKFYLAPGEKVLEVLSYCNLHGLWAAKLD